MLRNYIKVAIRNLARNKLYSAISIFSLSIGLAVSLFLLGHICYEFSFEEMHENKEYIYRVNATYSSGDTLVYTSRVFPSLGKTIKETIPAVEHAAVFRTLGNIKIDPDNKGFAFNPDPSTEGFLHDGNVLCGNTDFLHVFTVPLLYGEINSVLKEPFSVIISKEIVDTYFNGEYPIGQSLRISKDINCRITGVMQTIPQNTQIHCDFIVSYKTLEKMGEDINSWRELEQDYAYLLIDKEADPGTISSQIKSLLSGHISAEQASKYKFELQPLNDVYFSTYGSGRRGDLGPHGEISVFFEIGTVVIFILLLSIASYVNLATARSGYRVREVGMRKVLGASRKDLIYQFLGESILLTFLSVILSIIMYEIFNATVDIFPREMLADLYNNVPLAISLFALTIIVGILAGFYPALYLSRFQPIAIFQSQSGMKSSKSLLRKVLVVFQFSIAICLVCSTIIMYEQVEYLSDQVLGFDKENILVLEFEGEDASEKCMIMKNEILSGMNVSGATVSNAPPGQKSFRFYGLFTDPERDDKDMIVGRMYDVDYDFIDMFDLEITKGSSLSDYKGTVTENTLIISENMAELLGVDDPVGRILYSGGEKTYTIIGVVNNFYGNPLFQYVETGAIVRYNPQKSNTLSIKLHDDNIAGSVREVGKIWEKVFPNKTFAYEFLENKINNMYSEAGPFYMMMFFAGMTIIMACFGIFGLVSFASEQRSKEIGIRKVLGSSVMGIVTLLSREFLILVAVANVIAWPVAYFLMEGFLDDYTIRVNIGIGVFLATGLSTIALALVVAGFRAVKAALANPVDTIRYE